MIHLFFVLTRHGRTGTKDKVSFSPVYFFNTQKNELPIGA